MRNIEAEAISTGDMSDLPPLSRLKKAGLVAMIAALPALGGWAANDMIEGACYRQEISARFGDSQGPLCEGYADLKDEIAFRLSTVADVFVPEPQPLFDQSR